MAGASLLTLLDDIALLLDDVAVMTKVAAGKTAGVLGDDLALNAEQVSGVRADREIPVVWAVAKGSLKNKAILVPAAMLISIVVPMIIIPLLMLGGLYLCYEGMEKIVDRFFHDHPKQDEESRIAALLAEHENSEAFEQDRIKGAIRTDFVLSAEIIVIVLGVVQGHSLGMQFVVLSLMAVLMTVGVYGLVAAIVKIDDLGLYMVKNSLANTLKQRLGLGLVAAAPYLMKLLTVLGTIAMFLVGGGIIVHGMPAGYNPIDWFSGFIAQSGVYHHVSIMMINAVVGLITGLVAVLLMALYGRITADNK